MAEAKFKIGVEGADRSEQELRRVKDTFGGIDQVSSGVTGTLKAIGEGFFRLGVDVAKAANDMKAINFGAAADKYKAFDDQITRMAVRGGKSSDELRRKFSEMGSAAGVGTGRFAENVKQFDRMTFSGLDDAAESVKALGIAAEDADMSIEEMAGLGADLYQKLGVPAAKIGDELKRIKAMATDASIPGGLGAMVGILGKLTAAGGNRVQGGSARLGAMVTALREQGMNPEMATEQAGKMIQMVNSLPAHLVTRSLKGVYGKNYNPYMRDQASGRMVLRDDAYEGIQKVFKRSPNEMGALLGQTGFSAEGLELAHTFKDMNWGRVRKIQRLPDELKAGGAIPIEDFAKGGQATKFAQDLYDRARGKAADDSSEFSRTAAGGRVRTEQEKSHVEMRVGAAIQGARDTRNAAYKGRRGMQAAEDTITSFMPSSIQNAIQLGTAASYAGSGSIGTASGGKESEALSKAADALNKAASAMSKLPQATADSVRSLQRTSPLGAASADAKPPAP